MLQKSRLKSAVEEGLSLEEAITRSADTSISEALEISKGKPVLIIDKEHYERLVGIVTPFDLL